MYIRKSNGSKIEPCGTPASTDDQFEHWPLSTTFWNLLFKKLSRRLRGDFVIFQYAQALSNALNVSRKIVFTSRVGLSSKLAEMS